MKYITLGLLTLTFISLNVVSEPSNKTRFIPLLKSKLGTYNVVSSNSQLCVNSKLTLIKDNNPSAGFQLGKKIIFGSLHNGTQTIKQPGFCFITSTIKYKSDALEYDLRLSRCENISNEGTLRQSIQFLANNTLKYTLSDSDVTCIFEKVNESQ